MSVIYKKKLDKEKKLVKKKKKNYSETVGGCHSRSSSISSLPLATVSDCIESDRHRLGMETLTLDCELSWEPEGRHAMDD